MKIYTKLNYEKIGEFVVKFAEYCCLCGKKIDVDESNYPLCQKCRFDILMKR